MASWDRFWRSIMSPKTFQQIAVMEGNSFCNPPRARRFGFHATPFTREIAVKDRFTLDDFDQAIDAILRTLDSG